MSQPTIKEVLLNPIFNNNLLQFWLGENGFAQFLANLHKGEA